MASFKKPLIIIAIITISTCLFTEEYYQNEFSNWKIRFGRKYQDDVEENHRFNIFKQTIDFVYQHNLKKSSWKAGVGKFADQTIKDLQGKQLMEPQHCSATNSFPLLKGNGQTVAHKDWRDQKIVPPVKDQGHCGSCWAFSTTACMESHWALYKNLTFGSQGNAPLLAEQQLVDCAGDFNNFGCNGGLPSQAFEYLYYTGGQDTEEQYPYTAETGDTCKLKKPFAASLKGQSVNMTDEDDILFHATNVGPISIAYQVMDDFMHYESGVYHNDNCGDLPSEVNHAVLVVGFGHDDQSNLDYWIVKNSWNTDWGIDGYFWIQRGVNMCGVGDCASFPDVAGVYYHNY